MEKENILKCVEILRKMGLRRNALTGCLEKKEGGEWEPADLRSVWLDVCLQMKIEFDTFFHIANSSKVSPTVNPFKTYLEELPPPKLDFDPFCEIGGLVHLLRDNAENRKTLKNHLKKWFLATVRSVYENEFVNKNCLVFIGREGIGKTPFLKSFIPRPIRKSIILNPSIGKIEKYSTLGFSFLEEMGEWFNRCGGAYREILTCPKIISFLGCSRDTVFLEKINTSTSQFVCVEVSRILNRADIERRRKELIGDSTSKRKPAEEFNIDLAWSKALDLYRKGEPTEYTQEELERIKKDNKIALESDEAVKIIMQYFRPADYLDKEAKHFTSTAVSDLLNKKQKSYIFNRYRTGVALSKAGFKIKWRGKTKGYYISKIC